MQGALFEVVNEASIESVKKTQMEPEVISSLEIMENIIRPIVYCDWPRTSIILTSKTTKNPGR